MRKWLALVAVAACAASAACGGSGGAKVTARIVGGTKRERAMARSILERMLPSPVTLVRFRGLQHDAIHHWPGRRVDVTGRTTTNEDYFEEEVFAYSYALLARAHHIPVGFVTTDDGAGPLDAELHDGTTRPTSDSDLHAYEDKLREAAKEGRASISFRELRPGPVALAATVTTSTPALFLQRHLAPFWTLWQQPPPRLMGSRSRSWTGMSRARWRSTGC